MINDWLKGGGRNPTDVWYFDRVNNMTKKKLNLSHPTIYPLSMIVRIVKMATNPGDTVLDPFAGSGTSLVAAKIMGRNGIGFELDEKYREECMRRLETEGTMPASVFDEMNEDAEKKIIDVAGGLQLSEQIDKIVYSLLENPIEDKKIDCQCFLNENQKELVLDASSVFVQNIIEQAKNSAVNIKNNNEFGMCLATWLKEKETIKYCEMGIK